ncbi:YbfB/YjiJ family MFS transporter [Ectothiorhodospiraceae bacterium WFHF3C12]|nr:YbfB/YjiJ family MFS transporter [Ectothiorhodospiraceae bacterium WFHF3C12]
MSTESARLPMGRVLAGAAAILVGLGLSRFAFPPLMPAMIDAGWFDAPRTAYLGASNLLGYMIGAISAAWFANRVGAARAIHVSMVTVSLSFLLCVQPAPFVWFFAWRLLSGWAGAVLMVVAASTVLTDTAPERRAMAGAIVFSGSGVGVLGSATLVPWLVGVSLGWAWFALGALALALTVVTWPAWRDDRPIAAETASSQTAAAGQGLPIAVLLVVAAYSVEALGYVPHALFWVDFLAREQGLGMAFASTQWGVFAIGGICGSFLTGWMAHRLGWYGALVAATLIMAAAVGASGLARGFVVASLCSFFVGAMAPGIVSLTSGYLAHLVPLSVHRRAWGWATAAFAVSQAVAAYGMAGLFDWLGAYQPLFFLGAAGLVLGLAIVALSRLPVLHAARFGARRAHPGEEP